MDIELYLTNGEYHQLRIWADRHNRSVTKEVQTIVQERLDKIPT